MRFHLLFIALLCLIFWRPVMAADELCLTGNFAGAQNLPVTFTTQPDAIGAMFDGSLIDANGVNYPGKTPIVLKFSEPVRVTRVAVAFYNDPPKSYNATGRIHAAAKLGNTLIEESAWVSTLDTPMTMDCGTDTVLTWSGQSEVTLKGTQACDTLAIDIEKYEKAYQCLVREVYVWGVPERLATMPASPIPFTAADNTYASIRLQWDNTALPADTAYVRVRYRAKGALGWSSVCFTKSPALLAWLTPDTEYEMTAEAVGGPQQAGKAVVLRGRLPNPTAVRTMGDLWGMNFYPGGGGAHQNHPDEHANVMKMLDLLQAAGVRHIRWWIASPGFSRALTERGMTLYPSVPFTNPAANTPDVFARFTQSTGVWLGGTTNEPDFSNVFADDYVKSVAAAGQGARTFSKSMYVAGPALGGELVGPGADYLTAMYQAGAKDALGAIDIHPYSKRSTPITRGCVASAPENLLFSIRGCQDVLTKMGDAAKPIIVTESGYPTYDGDWFVQPITPERQTQWIVRSHLVLAAAGVNRIFIYAFQDEGIEPKEPEHHFGIVDWQGNPKPAYKTYSVMTSLLSEAKCQGFENAVQAPVFAVRCAVTGGYITPVWDGGGTSEVRLRADAAISKIISLTGDALPVPTAQGNELTLTVDENVRYVYSKRPLQFLGQRRITPQLEPMVDINLLPSTVVGKPGTSPSWQVKVTSEFDCPVKITLGSSNPWGGAVPAKTVTLPPRGTATVTMSLQIPATATTRIASWEVSCQYTPTDTRWHEGSFSRAIYFVVPKGFPAK